MSATALDPIGYEVIRNRLLAITDEMRVALQSVSGSPTVTDASDFFTGLFATALEPDELLTEIEIPRMPPRTGCAFQEISRRHGDYALAGAAAVVTLDEHGVCSAVRVALLSVADRPVLAEQASRVLTGHSPAPDVIRAAAEAAGQEFGWNETMREAEIRAVSGILEKRGPWTLVERNEDLPPGE